MSFSRRYSRERFFQAGLLARVACAPFLLQWFHPDERQMLEFAHFHAHGRLHPFLESRLHLRNQTLPWLLSGVIRAMDSVDFSTPAAYLLAFHLLIGLWSGVGLWALLECFSEEFPESTRAWKALGWFFALFWGFPFLYSRQLLEAVSFPAAALLLLAMRRRRALQAGAWAGLGAIFRYPSALWAAGAALAWVRRWRESRRPGTSRLRDGALFLAGCGLAVAAGGLADLATYGRFLDSAPAYWAFNHPHGPVEGMFGNDSLYVYWRWFEYLFTPWLAPLAILGAAYALTRRIELLLFTLPYLAGHLWTPHREPRFMLPLTPFLALVVAEAWCAGAFGFLRSAWARSARPLRLALLALALLHVGMNFLWYPLNAWAQRRSALGALILAYPLLAREPRPLMDLSDPPIDALVPPDTRWADPDCRWHRPETSAAAAARLPWVLAPEAPAGCRLVRVPGHSGLPALPQIWQRLLRVRDADLWECPAGTLHALCPNGLTGPEPGEPLLRTNR